MCGFVTALYVSFDRTLSNRAASELNRLTGISMNSSKESTGLFVSWQHDHDFSPSWNTCSYVGRKKSHNTMREVAYRTAGVKATRVCGVIRRIELLPAAFSRALDHNHVDSLFIERDQRTDR
jgi:hypothetical protein